MKKILSIIIISLLICFSFGVQGFSKRNDNLQFQISPGDYFRFINIDGRIRSYRIHIPPSYDNLVKMPIVFVLHGYPDNSQLIKTLSGMDDTADSEGFIVVYPNGEIADMKGLIISLTLLKTLGRVWNCWNINNVNDVNFFRFLIEDLQTTLNIDSSKIYITGFSGGAMMTYRLGAELSDIVAAIAPVAGSIGGIWHEWPEDSSIYNIPEPLNPIPIIIFHGTEDYNVPYDGGWVRNKLGPFEFNLYFCSVNESVSFWVENNGCEPNPSINISDNEKIIKKTYSNNIDNSEVILYTFVNGGHEWFGSSWFTHSVISINDLIWEFFEAHPKQ